MKNQDTLVDKSAAPNNVLLPQARRSQNFYHSDRILSDYLRRCLGAQALSYMRPRLEELGRRAAAEMDALSMDADKHGPELVKRDFYGQTINRVKFHPAYERLMQIALDSGMLRVKWAPAARATFHGDLHKLGFAAGYLFAMSESGLFCPLCMTDGAARLIDRFCEEEDKARLLPRIYTDKAEEFYTGAMFLTEKSGGSDVGANQVAATPAYGAYYRLNGEKWFCSNANAQIAFALARTDPDTPGVQGLGIFLVEKTLPDGRENPMDIVRLKEKLGVRSMASAEIIFTNTMGKLVGGPKEGFKIMTEMINLSRLYNSAAAVACLRRALIEAYQFLQYRVSFGKIALEHPLIRTKLTELSALHLGNFYLLWRAIEALDAADNGDADEGELLRFLTPMTKKCTAQDAVYAVRESMELMGGIGYIEDGVMPKIMRDVMVLPIWEGAGNIMTLDMLRAARKSKGLEFLLAEIEACARSLTNQQRNLLNKEVGELTSCIHAWPDKDPELVQAESEPVFARLTRIYQVALLQKYRHEVSQAWIDPATRYWTEYLSSRQRSARLLFDRDTVEAMLAWDC